MLLLETSFHKRLFRPSVTTVFIKDQLKSLGSLPVFLQLNPDARETMQKKKRRLVHPFSRLQQRSKNNLNDGLKSYFWFGKKHDVQILIKKVKLLSLEDTFQVRLILFQTECKTCRWMSGSFINSQMKTINSPFLRKKTLLVIYKRNTLPLFI